MFDDRPVPCFKCNTLERMSGHVVCDNCHRPDACHVCNPTWSTVYHTAFPERLTPLQHRHVGSAPS